MESDSLVKICSSAFSVEDIEKAKSLLFHSISTELRNIKRKTKSKEGKSSKDLFDIINVFKVTDSEKLPVFVACDLNKLPPITWDHLDVSRFLKDITVLKQDLEIIKDTYASKLLVQQMKQELMCNRYDTVVNDSHQEVDFNFSQKANINNRRGAHNVHLNLNSGPIGLPPHLSFRSGTENDEASHRAGDTGCVELPSRSRVRTSSVASASSAEVLRDQREANTALSVSAALAQPNDVSDHATVASHLGRESSSGSGELSGHSSLKNVSKAQDKSFVDVLLAPGEWKREETNSEWVTVQKKRYKNRFIGDKGTATTNTNCNFRAAEPRIPLFINNVDRSTLPGDIVDYIREKTNIKVTLVKVSMKQDKDYDAYKMFVPRQSLDIFMNEALWPKNISFRRFIHFKNRQIDSAV
ncbi:uncharacterized protein LOC133529337 [Cydia pomonella]|uniref:uncharacterized protein LOC133529337 n=1 Tax=Cydia pomonella TaxID=82600 RepID=UPI002ADDAE67|nr:uncharacterized protein LOC133529337 [Cydia pomonella]